MKQFLVLLAVLPLMLLVMAEFILDTSINAKIDAINDIVYTNREVARENGTFRDVIENMQEEIAGVAGVDKSLVDISKTYASDPIPRLTSVSAIDLENNKDAYLIHYHIEVPIEEMKALGGLIFPGKPRYIYTIDSYVASEYVIVNE